MKKSTYIVIGILILILGLFYGNMYRKGTFNSVEISRKENTVHTIQGKWFKGTFSKGKDEDAFFEFQTYLIDSLKQSKICTYYTINPTPENHNCFEAFVGVAAEKDSPLLDPSFKTVTFRQSNVLTGKQLCMPAYQRVHSKLMEDAEAKKIKLDKNNIYEEYSQNDFYVEMKLK